MNSLLAAAIVFAADPTPEPADVKAGWVAFGIFIALAVAVVLIGYFLNRSLRRSRDTAEAGGYDESAKRAAEQQDDDRPE